MGTRERIVAYLAEAGELFDANGMASTRLAAAVGYPGSSVAFAQLLSGMERSGLIEREVRGKRTYRISLGPAHHGPARVVSGVTPGVRAAAAVPGIPRVSAAEAAGPGMGGFDYDELARRLLVQVVRRLAATDAEASTPDRSAADRPASAGQPVAPDPSVLQETVSGLEYELATAWTKHGKLAEENVRLRQQLKAAQRSLALAAEQVRRLPAGTDLSSHEVMLLQRLLTSEPTADSTDEPAPEAPSLLG